MKVTYICHSGFLVETAESYYLFDYFKGVLPDLDAHKQILVFASHRHPDHYNPAIFEKLKNMGMEQITAVLSKDIPKRNYPKDIPVITVTFHQSYQLPFSSGTLHTLHSTDQGVAFLIICNQGCFYHAGDLNDWVWAEETEQYNKQMTGSYRHEIKILSEILNRTALDIAMLPLDPRQEKDYANGMLYFLQKVHTKKAFPMHYWERPSVIQQFIREYPDFSNVIENTETYVP